MSLEIWKDVLGWEGFYEVSNHGRVRSLPRLSRLNSKQPERKRLMGGKIRQPSVTGRYLGLALTANNRKQFYPVHILVLESFCCPRPKGLFARHLNGDAFDNRPENLAWGTHLENMQDRMKHGRYAKGENHPMAKLSDQQFLEIINGSLTYLEVSIKYGISKTHAFRLVTEARSSYEKTGNRSFRHGQQARLLCLQESRLRRGAMRNPSHTEQARDGQEGVAL